MTRLLKKSWHEAFFECASPHTDAPDNFVVWSAISLLGATLKNNVFFERGVYTLWPNQFIVLVAPPGIGKGTAMNIAMDLAEDMKPQVPVNVLGDRITAERMLQLIADGWPQSPKFVNQQLIISPNEHSCWLLAEELRVLLSSSEWMLQLLEAAWSQKKFTNQTKNKGSDFIEGLCLSMLAASVPDFLKNLKNEVSMVISGGFSSRCIFVYADAPSKDLPWPEPLKSNARSAALYDALKNDLQEISRLSGKFVVDPDARLEFEKFLRNSAAAGKQDDIEAIAHFRARSKAHVLKLGMILSASRGDTLHISRFDMLNSINMIERVMVDLIRLFRGSGDNPDASLATRALELVERYGRISKKELFTHLHRHLSYDSLGRVLWTLESIDVIETVNVGKQELYQLKQKVIPTATQRVVAPIGAGRVGP